MSHNKAVLSGGALFVEDTRCGSGVYCVTLLKVGMTLNYASSGGGVFWSSSDFSDEQSVLSCPTCQFNGNHL